MILNIIIFILAITSKDFGADYSCNEYLSYKTDIESNATWTYLTHFDSFAALTTCNQSKFNITNYLAICPRRKLVVDESLQMMEFLVMSQFYKLNVLHLQNLIGIDVNSVLMKEKFTSKYLWIFANKIILNIYMSRFDIYSNGTRLSDENHIKDSRKCNESFSSNFINVFGALNFYSVVYPKSWCPYFFSLSNASRLIFQDISNRWESFIREYTSTKKKVNFIIVNL